MSTNKTQEHLKKLYKFRERVKYEILGEQNAEYRSELEWLLTCTDKKIRQVEDSLPWTRLI